MGGGMTIADALTALGMRLSIAKELYSILCTAQIAVQRWTEKGKKMWIDTTQVYGFSNPDEWREAENFAEKFGNLK